MKEKDGVGAGEAGEIADIGRVGDEQGIEPEGRELGQESLAAALVLGGRDGSGHGIRRSLPAVRRASRSR
jgi:hypothetical protein